MNNALYTIVFFNLVITVILAGLASHSFKGFLKCLWGIAMGGAIGFGVLHFLINYW